MFLFSQTNTKMSRGGLDNQRNFKAGGHIPAFCTAVQGGRGGEGKDRRGKLNCVLELVLYFRETSLSVNRHHTQALPYRGEGGFTTVTMETEDDMAPQKQHSVLECSVQM